MPPLDEGSILFMPISVPGMAIEEAKRLLQTQDKILKGFPAPLSMFETVIMLKPPAQWRPGMTKERLLEEMEAALKMPGLQNAWTMPIKARVDMLTTGIRTPIGVKVFGKDLKEIAVVAENLERILKDVPGTQSVYAERELGGFFLDFVPDRAAIGRYGLKVMEVLRVVETAMIMLLSVPFAAVGSIWPMYLMEFNTSMAVWVGMIALLGIATETASIMMVYLDQGYETWRKEGRIHSVADLIDMAVESATLRVRPLRGAHPGRRVMGCIPVAVSGITTPKVAFMHRTPITS